MHLHLIFTYFVATLINTYAKPVKSTSVYENMNSFIDIWKCPYLRTTKLFQPEPEFLLECTNFTTAKSLTKMGVNDLDQALCLLYYNSFEELCRTLRYLPTSTSLKTVLSNDIIDEAISTYQNKPDQVCTVLEKNTYIMEDVRPGIDTVYKYIYTGKCSKFCFDFDNKLNAACALTAFMANYTIQLQSFVASSLISKQPKEIIPKNKPNITEHTAGNLELQLGNSAQGRQSNNNSTNKPNSITSDLQNNYNNVPDSNEKITPELKTDVNIGSNNSNQAFAQKPQGTKIVVANPKRISQVTRTDTDLGNSAQINQQVTLSTPLPVVSESTVGIKQDSSTDGVKKIEDTIAVKPIGSMLNDVQSSVAQGNNVQKVPSNTTTQNADNKENSEIKNNAAESVQTKINYEPEITKNVEQNIGTKSEDGENTLGMPILDTSMQSNADTPKKEDINVNEKIDNNKSTTKNDGDVKAVPMLKNDPHDDNKEATEYIDEREEYEDGTYPKYSEVKAKPTERGKPFETIKEEGPNFPANYENQNIDDSDSYFFSYFMMVCIMFICAYVAYHNKQKILALVVEGRKGRRPSRTRRPNSANYRKLDSNLEEAVTSSCNKNATHVIY